jgi:hypothetical protein
MGYIDANESLTVRGVGFFEGLGPSSGHWDDPRQKTIAPGKVDPLVVSETLHDLAVLAAKGL